MKAYKKALAFLLTLLLVVSAAALALADDAAAAVAIDKEAFDALIASGPVADEADIAGSAWATACAALIRACISCWRATSWATRRSLS